jgi:DNA-binding MarR family transcriptional regulator
MRPTVFDVVADPNRRQILDLLREDEHSVSQLVAALSVSQPAVSTHLRAFERADDARPNARYCVTRSPHQVRTVPMPLSN